MGRRRKLQELVDRRRTLPGSIAVMETNEQASMINSELCVLESNVLRLAACWDGELDPIGAYSQLAYLHEKGRTSEAAARGVGQAVELVAGWEEP